MIKAIGWDGQLVVIGLERGNCERLLEHKPIIITPETLPGLRQNLLILGGEDAEAIERDIAEHLPPGAIEAAPPAPGEEVRATAAGVERVAAPDPDEVARGARLRALQDELEQTRRTLTLLSRAAWNALETSEDHVSEEQGLARMNALADLIGYPRPGGPPPRPQPTRKEALANVDEIGAGIEAALPGGWTFTLFIYQSRLGGEIAHLARDHETSRAVVRRWLEHVDASRPAGRA